MKLEQQNDDAHFRVASKIKIFIEENYQEKITLDLLSREACISKFYLQRVFKKNFNLSPQQYLQQYRIKKAVEMLRDTNLSIGDIGSRCGFISISNFSRAFKKCKGMSPVYYRSNKC